MSKGFIFGFAALFAAVLALSPDAALATTGSTAGQNALGDVSELVRGNIGTLIGLGLALLGLYMWLVQQASWGIVMIIGGIAVTAFPGFFDAMQTSFFSIFQDSGAANRKNVNTGTFTN